MLLLLPPEELEPEPLPEPLPLLEPPLLLDEPPLLLPPEPFEPPPGCVFELLPPPLLLFDGCDCCAGTGLLLFVVLVVLLPLFHGVHTNSAMTMTAAAMKPRMATIMPAVMPAAAAASPSLWS
jgi:hypothetical protein